MDIEMLRSDLNTLYKLIPSHLMCFSLSTSFDHERFPVFLSFPVLDANAILQSGTMLLAAVVARNETLISVIANN
jgi:hypothetical protein